MSPEVVDQIYEATFVPEAWPGVSPRFRVRLDRRAI